MKKKARIDQTLVERGFFESRERAQRAIMAGKVALDIGASTGGFTDCLLQRGAAKVFAVDVGRGQLAWKIRNDPRVIVMEKLNARFLSRKHIPQDVDLCVI